MPHRKQATITLFYDVVSPFSWLGFEAAHRYKNIWDYKLVLQPFFLGGIMSGTGNKPPATNPYKGKYMYQDLQLLGKLHQVPIKFPANFPENSLRAQRILTAIQMKDADKLEEASRQLWRLYWRDEKSLQSEDDLVEYLSPVLSDDLARKYVYEFANSAEVKEKLLTVTKATMDNEGSFGAPWDRMESIAFFLNKPYLGAVPVKEARL
ncbi:glutathione S-transferase kappa 1-like protein [Chytridium lagenaria]|nr:glutathione S-transferase kappa 1-like protein [Chytridium lagenaria]